MKFAVSPASPSSSVSTLYSAISSNTEILKLHKWSYVTYGLLHYLQVTDSSEATECRLTHENPIYTRDRTHCQFHYRLVYMSFYIKPAEEMYKNLAYPHYELCFSCCPGTNCKAAMPCWGWIRIKIRHGLNIFLPNFPLGLDASALESSRRMLGNEIRKGHQLQYV